MNSGTRCLAFVLLAAALAPRALPDSPTPPFREWGRETLAQMEAGFRLPDRALYADEVTTATGARSGPAFMWGCGVQLAALAAAARADRRTYAEPLHSFVQGLQVYWTEHNGIGGYDVLPSPKPPDRYYDDNVWIVLALADAYEATRDRAYLDQAEKTFRFVLSGEDDRLGGGIYWHEQDRSSKNTCSNAPSAAAALRLYQLTRKAEYWEVGLRLYTWTCGHLQDTDGLFFDNVRLDGSVERTKWSYNSALMIRTCCLLRQVTGNRKYLQEARRIAQAARTRWFSADTGAISDGAAFAHLLAESFLCLHREDRGGHWLDLVSRALAYVHQSVRDERGYYADRWDRAAGQMAKAKLLDQASAARAFWSAALAAK